MPTLVSIGHSEVNVFQKSHSPKRATTSKRSRTEPFNISLRTQPTGYDALPSRAESARGSSLPQNQDREASLPTSEDWAFRVKVISSATDLSNDLFKNAVHGLVRICFPEGILGQLGLRVLEQHMLEENAPTDNVRRMRGIFESEMIRRVTSILAEHLDTLAKVDSAVCAIVAGSAQLHGEQGLGEDILGHVSASLLRLKARAPEHSTEWLTTGDAHLDVTNSDDDVKTSDVSEEHAPPLKARSSKNRDKKPKLDQPTKFKQEIKDNDMDINATAALLEKTVPIPIRPLHKGKDRRISTKWQWNINPDEYTDDVLSELFTRTSDLFAYHALPIARQKLGSGASRKEIRCNMQTMFDNMHDSEYKKWFESLQKLLKGDRGMLDRTDPSDSDTKQQGSRETPAPIDMRKRGREVTKMNIEGVDDSLYKGNFIKRETAGSHYPVSKNAHETAPKNQIVETTVAIRHFSTEERDSGPPNTSVESHQQGPGYYQSNGNIDSVSLYMCILLKICG